MEAWRLELSYLQVEFKDWLDAIKSIDIDSLEDQLKILRARESEEFSGDFTKRFIESHYMLVTKTEYQIAQLWFLVEENKGLPSINSSLMVFKANVEAIFEDSKADPSTGVTAIQKLISVDKVSAVVGDIVSSVSIPAAVVAERNNVVMIAPTSSAPAITEAGPFIYRVWPSDLLEGYAAGNYAKQKGFKKAVILHLNNDYGTQIADIFKKNFEWKIKVK